MFKEPKVTLVRWTPNPIGTVKLIWDAAKTGQDLQELIDENPCKADSVSKSLSNYKEAEALFKKVIAMEIPVAEFVNFVFTFEDVPIFWREQLVRQRKASYWSQSHRIFDLSKFRRDELYYVPQSIRDNPEALQILEKQMELVELAYRTLVACGVPMEDARSVIPMNATHRISMQLDLRQLLYIIKERSCHILQGSIWKPIIDQMINELVVKVDPAFKLLKSPICYHDGKFIGCKFAHDNERRYEGKDRLPPCCIWMWRCKADEDPRELASAEACLPDRASYDKSTKIMVDYFGPDIL